MDHKVHAAVNKSETETFSSTCLCCFKSIHRFYYLSFFLFSSLFSWGSEPCLYSINWTGEELKGRIGLYDSFHIPREIKPFWWISPCEGACLVVRDALKTSLYLEEARLPVAPAEPERNKKTLTHVQGKTQHALCMTAAFWNPPPPPPLVI